jgi:hypothetical protein
VLDNEWSPWFKSTKSNPNGECVEIRFSADEVQVRDTQDRTGTVLTFARAAWLTSIVEL